jgi:hypothetical protein
LTKTQFGILISGKNDIRHVVWRRFSHAVYAGWNEGAAG